MLKVAITGNIASGKSTVESFLKEKYPVLDTDMVSHELLLDKNVQSQIESAFKGFDILEDNQISRRKLGKIIFYDEKRSGDFRKKLESILHPLIKKKIEHFFFDNEKNNEQIVFVSIPLLFEAKFESMFDKIILIYADNDIRIKRLMERSNLTLEQAQKRLDSQISQDEKVSLADYVVYNDKSLDELIFSLKILEENFLSNI